MAFGMKTSQNSRIWLKMDDIVGMMTNWLLIIWLLPLAALIVAVFCQKTSDEIKRVMRKPAKVKSQAIDTIFKATSTRP